MTHYQEDYAAFATRLMRSLRDKGGKLAHATYREYALAYPRPFLESTLRYVTSVPPDIATVSRRELFKRILDMTHAEEDED